MSTHLEWLVTGHDETQLVEVELFARDLGENQVRVMDRIEGSAEHADSHG